MLNQISINNQAYLLVRLAAERFEYSQDYITRLARERKVKALRRGRYWYVHVGSVQSYIEVQQAEQQIRRKLLHNERHHERMVRTVASSTMGVSQKKQRPLHFSSLVVCGLLVLCGGLLGVVLQSYSTPSEQLSLAASARLMSTASPEVVASTVELLPVFSTNEIVQVAPGRVIERFANSEEWSVIYPSVTE